MWNFHVDDYTEIRQNMNLGRYLLTALVLNLKILIMSSKEVMDHFKGA